MIIKSIETKHVTEQQFLGLVEIEGEFEPYYSCRIVTDNGNANSKGETAEQAEAAAVELLKTREANKVSDAYSAYLAENGVYFVDC